METLIKPTMIKQAEADYDAALDAFREASKKFTQITEKYRNREIDDPAFLSAKSEFNKANEVFDAEESKFLAIVNEDES